MKSHARDLTVFALLLAIGVFGRWAQPTWNFTPMAAVTAVGGYYFASPWAAVLLPVSVLAVSDLTLPVHDSAWVQASVHLMMVLPLLLGRWARGRSPKTQVGLLALCGVAPATAFFVVTNFAVWAFKSNYERTLAGLGECYAAGLPFYRAMLAGDVFYMTVLAACLMLAGEFASRRTQPAVVPNKR
ncbi:MAG: DUF6580 family putative transport protein [Planctomycetota bacterium]